MIAIKCADAIERGEGKARDYLHAAPDAEEGSKAYRAMRDASLRGAHRDELNVAETHLRKVAPIWADRYDGFDCWSVDIHEAGDKVIQTAALAAGRLYAAKEEINRLRRLAGEKLVN